MPVQASSFVDGRFCFASFFSDISCIVQIILYMTLIIKAQSVAIDYRFYSIRNLHMCIVPLLMQYCRKKSRLISVLYELKCSSILRFIYL